MNTSMFSFEPVQYRAQFATHGYVHIREGISLAFYRRLSEQVEEHLAASSMRVSDKQQAVYAFPEDGDYLTDLCEAVGCIVDIDPSRLVLSERHIKAYASDTEPYPPPHKDRFASQISLGISIYVPERSRLVLYPYALTEDNPFNSAVRLRADAEDPSLFLSSPAALRGSGNTPDPWFHKHPNIEPPAPQSPADWGSAVEISDTPRDVIIFKGHSTWHRRIHSAGTQMLYLKLNSFNSDPLGEDPRTTQIRRNTLQLCATGDAALLACVPMIGRGVDYFHNYFTRQWQEVASTVFWGERHFRLSAEEITFVKLIDGRRSIAELSGMAAIPPDLPFLRQVRQLAKHGVIELTDNVPPVRLDG